MQKELKLHKGKHEIEKFAEIKNIRTFAESFG